ncbi:MAG: DivIVA domain-containing protein [Eggerthellaceae bacterium]|nr:DivIVA domain-containing protein [Eggerthellaceae bacterium]
MALTANDVNTVSFSVDRKGYNVDEVDVFLEQVASSFDELYAQADGLREELRAAEENAAAAPASVDGEVVTVAELEERDNRIAELEAQVADHRADDSAIAQALIIAQRSADEIIANANKAADGTKQDAEDEAQRILDKANAEKARVLEEIRKLEADREDARARFADMLNSFIASSETILGELDATARRGSMRGMYSANSSDEDVTSEFGEIVADGAAAAYTTPTTGGAPTPVAPTPSPVEKDFSGFGDTDDGFELDDID